MFDISLLYELKKGNREAFNGAFRYYYPRIMAYTASMVEQKAAEDIVQDVFLYVWENREKLYVSDGFHSYLFQSAYTRCLDYFKKNLSIEKYHSHTYFVSLHTIIRNIETTKIKLKIRVITLNGALIYVLHNSIYNCTHIMTAITPPTIQTINLEVSKIFCILSCRFILSNW